MIECRGVTARAGEFMLRDVDLTVPAGGYAVLAGPTASGKTTLLETIAGARTPVAGGIVLDDVDVTALPPERRRVGFAYQHGYLFPHLDVVANVAYGAREPGVARELLERFDATTLAPRRVGALSGGERQIVALCRALATRPRILLLDEPFSAIDRERRDAVRNVVAALQREWRMTTLHVTHDESDVLPLEPMRLEMRDGQLV